MDNAESLVIEGEDYKVVDECDESESIQNSQNTENVVSQKIAMENNSSDNKMIVDEGSNTKCNVQSDQETTHVKISDEKDSNIEQPMDTSEDKDTETKSSCPETSKDNTIDFTADITLDQLTDSKDVTDEDVMQHLDEIEKIDINSSTFDVDDKKNAEGSSASNTELDKEKKVKNEWYEKKLAEKVTTVKERLSKLARVLEFSYPNYKKWLELAEKIGGTPTCKLEPARDCPLDKPYTNRWKFICSRKNVQEATKEAGSTDGAVNKNVETVWRLEPTGAWGVNVNNDSEFPPFVLRAVKTFEDFLQSTEQPTPKVESFSDDVSLDVELKKENAAEAKQMWLWLLVRCNSMDELMLFTTGKNISRQTMDRLKQVYETGPGKDCNVKSLYCKSVNVCNDTTVTNTTFLVGSEALDEVVGGVKVQLAPKTNFWSNAAGAENIAKAVIDLLNPTPETTILEIGCGIGLIGLIMASKCERVIGVDSQSEIEEAEMTCELNNIKNASFIMGSPNEVTSKIISTVKKNKTYAVINANTNFGRALDVMTCLRKINSLRRLVIITTLTKQSVRAILELARPFDRNIGPPFIPVRACVVDTSPIGPHFEVVILMERLMVSRLKRTFIMKMMNIMPTTEVTENVPKKTEEKTTANQPKKNPVNKAAPKFAKKNNKLLNKTGPIKKGKFTVVARKFPPNKGPNNPGVKGFTQVKGKRMHSPERTAGGPPKKIIKKNENTKYWRPDAPGKKGKEWVKDKPELRNDSVYAKKNAAANKDQADPRDRLSNNRVDPDIAQKVKEHQALLDIAKEKLNAPTPTIDMSTAKQLQSMLNMVLEQTNKLQSQLPRSVWDRISPPENAPGVAFRSAQEERILKDRYVQKMGNRDIIITAPNKKFVDDVEDQPGPPGPPYKRYNDVRPLEPNAMPVGCPSVSKPPPERYMEPEFRKPQGQGNNWGKEKMMEEKWNDMSGMRKTASPVRRPVSPVRRHHSPGHDFSLKRPLLSPPRHTSSPPRRHLSPTMYSTSQLRAHELLTRPMVSPHKRLVSPPRHPMFQSRRQMMPPEHESQMMRSSSMTQGSSQGFAGHRMASPPRRQQSPPRHQLSPPRKSSDDWNNPGRSIGEQGSWSRPNERMPEKTWRDEKPLSNSGNWGQQLSGNDRYPKAVHQDKFNTKDSAREGVWLSGIDTWNKQQFNRQQLSKNSVRDTWSSSDNNRWSNTSNMTSNVDTWRPRGKDNFESREEPWSDKARWKAAQTKEVWSKPEKEDWNDLPEDARDPWGDDGNLGLKDRISKFDSPGSSSFWSRDTEKEGTWKSRGQSLGTKASWQSADNQNTGDKRWAIHDDKINKVQRPTSWQSGSNFSSWEQKSFNFPTQRQFNTTQFNNRR